MRVTSRQFKGAAIVILLAGLAAASTTTAAVAAAADAADTRAATPPHVLVFVLDDVGWRDVSFHGGHIPTPYLDSLAARGVALNRYYVHPVCTPSRIALLTGRYSHASGFGSGGVIMGAGPYSLPEGTPTLPSELRRRGYQAHMVGKWHCGSVRLRDTPVGSRWGFQSFLGCLHGAGGHYSKVLTGPDGPALGLYDLHRGFANGSWTPVLDERHSSKLYAAEAQARIDEHASRGDAAATPLFLYVALQAAHTPAQCDDEWLEPCQHLPHPFRRDFCGMVVGADEAVRNVTEHARRVLGDNIVVAVTTDNGGMLHVGGLNTPLRGGKNTGYEGGVRGVGLFADLTPDQRHLSPAAAGTTFDGLMHVADWQPTLLDIVDCASHAPHRGATDTGTAESDATLASGLGYSMRGAWRGAGADTQSVPAAEQPSPLPKSPRREAVLVLDRQSNFVSFLKPPYKLLLGHMGSGEWAVEPQGHYLLGDQADLVDKAEEHVADWMDWYFGTRDVSFFWKEVAHIIAARVKRVVYRDTTPDLYTPDAPMLGPGDDVLSGGVVQGSDVPLQLFNVYDDPSEREDLAASHPAVVQRMVRAFNVHWAASRRQFNWSSACMDQRRFRVLPQSFCTSQRRSHLHDGMHQRSIDPAVAACRWEQPFVPDDHPDPCGRFGPVRDIKAVFMERLQSAVRRVLVTAALSVAVAVATVAYACGCRSRCRRACAR